VNPIRILLADDHALFRAGIRSLLQNLGDMQIVAEAQNGREALQLVETLQPDLLLIDIGMPELNGLEVAERVTKDFSHVRVIILSMHATAEYARRAVRAGAAGYILKGASTAELDLAVRSVARGETYLSPAVSKLVVADYARRVKAESSSLEQLTPRQREILQLIAEGHTTQQIAQKLEISTKTAEMHRAQLMERLDIHDIAGLVRYAIREGLVSPDD
jgi:DNA-binding NarL/FixJ family response regulator